MSSTPPRPIDVHPLRCGRCGGSFEEGAATCPWCGGGIALEDRRRGHVCPRCSARAPAGADWCPGCGERLDDQRVAPLASAAACPACPGTLREREVGSRRLTECGGCGGLWLPAALLDALCAEAERAGIADLAPEPAKPAREEEIRYRPCAACGALMMRRNFGGSSGVVVDLCRAHGVWLDAHELERVLAWARGGGLERERTRRVERARRAAQAGPSIPVAPIPAGRTVDAWGDGGSGLLEILAALLKRLG